MTELTPGPADPIPADVEALVARVADEFEDRRARGEHPNPEEYAARHPEAASVIREVLGLFRLIGEPSTPGSERREVGRVGWGRLGDFRLLREIGRGGMGVVYEAQQISLGRRVALKVLPFGATVDPRRVQRFEHEARAAALLHHEHIVPVYAVGSDRGVHYYAMQFIDGRTIADLIADVYHPMPPPPDLGAPTVTQAGPAETSEPSPTAPVMAATTARSPRPRDFARTAAAIAADAADALEHAHALGVVHRDVKPGNLLLDRAGKVWVTDFGLARLGPGEGVTLTGDMLGTLRYMAPEQALAKHGLVDHRADIYALGATLYELLTGVPVVHGEDREDVLRAIAFEDPVPPRVRDRSILPDLETVVLKCLEKDPVGRYQLAGELADDLRRFLAGEPVRAKRAGRWERARKWVRRQPALAALLVVSTASLAGLAAGLLWHNHRLQREAENTARERDAARDEQRWAAQAVDDMYTRVAEEWLGRQPRLQPLQRDFLEKALAYYERAADRDDDDPIARRKRPALRLRIGTIQTTLGRHAAAEDALRKSVAEYEGLAAESRGDLDIRFGEYLAAGRLATTVSVTGRYAEAAEAHGRALELAVRLVRDFPERRDFLPKAAGSRGNVAFNLALNGHNGEAEANYRSAIRELEQLPQDVRDHRDARFFVANIRGNLAKLYQETGRPAESEPLFRQAAAGFERLAGDAPANTEYRWHWAFTLSNLGVALTGLEQLTEARPVLVRAEALLARLAEDFRDLPDTGSDLAAVQGNLGVVLWRLGEAREAEQYYHRAVATLGDLVTRVPGVPDHRVRLGAFQQNLGKLLSRTGRHEDAESMLREAVQTCERLVADFPGVPNYQSDLAVGLSALGNAAMKAGKFSATGEAYRRALGVHEKLLTGDSSNAALRAPMAETCNNFALLLAWYEGPPYPRAERAAGLARRAVELQPRSGSYWRTLGLAEFRAGNWRECLAAFNRARELGSSDGSDNFFQAMAHWQVGAKDDSRRHYDSAARWLQRQKGPDQQILRLWDDAAAMLGIAIPTPGPPPREVAR